MARTVQRWTGRESRALREALRLSVRSFAHRLGVSDRAISKWEAGAGERVPNPESQAILDTAFQQADSEAQARFWEKVGGSPTSAMVPSTGISLVPDLEPWMIARDNLLDELVTTVLSRVDAAKSNPVAVVGPGGFGKTTVATQVAHDVRVREVFPEVLWVETGEDCTPARVTQLVSDLCFHLDGTRPELSDPEQAGFHLARVIGERHLLLVIDNVWSGADLAPFLLGAPHCLRLVTTRNMRVLPSESEVLRLGPMRPDEVAELLHRALPEASTMVLRPVAELCGGWPLLASLVGSSVSSDIGSGAPPEQALQIARETLQDYGPQAFDVWDSGQRKVTISHVISATLHVLDANVQLPGADGLSERYLSMAVFPPATPIPLTLLSRWWGVAHGWSPMTVRQFCRALADRSLISAYRADQDVIVLHDVFRSYLRRLVGAQIAELHRSLLEALRPVEGWTALRPEQTYEWAHLTYHLAGAGDHVALADLVGDPRYVVGKALVCGSHSLRADRDLVTEAEAATRDSALSLKLDQARFLAGQGYLLHGQGTSAEMAATLLVALARDRDNVSGDLAAMTESHGVSLNWVLAASDRSSPGHVGTVVTVASREDLLVSGGEDGLVRLWGLDSRQLQRALRGHTGWVHAVAISPDGSLVASAGEDEVIRLWSTTDGRQVAVLPGHEKRIRALAFMDRAGELVSGAEDGLIKYWDLSSLTLARQTTTRGVGIWSIALSPDNSMVAASGEDEYVRLLDVATGDLLDEKALHRSWVRAVRFRNDDELISAAADGTARIWRTSNRQLEPIGALDAEGEWLRTVALHDGHVITAGEAATVTSHEPKGRRIRMPANVNWVRAVTSTPRGVAIACEDGGIRVWTPQDNELHTLAPGRNTIWSAAFTTANIALGEANGTISLHDRRSGERSSTLVAGAGRVWSLAAAQEYLAGACGDGRIRIWRGGDLLHELNHDVTLTWAVRISEDGSLLAASDTNGHVRVWTLPDGDLVWDHDAAAGRVRSLSISATSDLLAAAGGDGVVRVWTLSTGAEQESLKVPGWARTVAFDSIGERLAVGAGTGDIYIHRPTSAEALHHLPGHRGRVLMLGFNPDGSHLVSAAADGTARRWHVANNESFQLRADASGQCATFDPASMSVLVASASGAVLMNLDPNTEGNRR